MKENPAMQKIMNNMKPGVISLHGFLGTDKRDVEQIIDHDTGVLEGLNMTKEQIADKLDALRDLALEGLGNFITLNKGYLAKADSIRGKLPCPFPHAGVYRKTVITIKHEESGKEILFTDLGIHLIREHGFFQGKGSLFRLEPEDLAPLMDL